MKTHDLQIERYLGRYRENKATEVLLD